MQREYIDQVTMAQAVIAIAGATVNCRLVVDWT